MKNYGLSIDFAQQCLHSIEAQLGVKKGAALQEARYSGPDAARKKQSDKNMTSYAIALHLLGKNLLHLSYLKESKHFITKAHFVITKMLTTAKKPDLELAIQVDMQSVLERLRAQEEEGPDASALKGGKRSLRKDTGALTDEDIERSLATIKSGLATVTEGQDSVQEKFREVEAEVQDLPGDHASQFKEEFRDVSGLAVIAKDE